MRQSRGRGFSLLELMVVVALVGLAAAMIVPNLTRPDADALQEAEEQLRNRVSVLADRSLVRGELLAIRLEKNRVGFLRYDFAEGAFLPLADEARAEVTFDEPVHLEWQLPDNEGQDPDLAAVVEQRLAEQVDATTDERPRDDEISDNNDENGNHENGANNTGETGKSADQPFPQLFFFPSGEVTPATLWLRNADAEQEITLKLDSLGRLRRPQQEDDDGT